MALVVAFTADLLFGSRVQGALRAGAHEVELIADEPRLRARLAGAEAGAAAGGGSGAPDVLVVDLTDPDLDGAAIVESLLGSGELAGTLTLGFYSHVDAGARARAQDAGFDLVVPRSRMAREGAGIVARMQAGRAASG